MSEMPAAPRTVEARAAERRRQRHRSLRPAANLTIGGSVLSAVSVLLGVWSAAPIYETGHLWVVALGGWVLAAGIVWLGRRYAWGALTAAALIAAFVVTLVPIAVPQALTATSPTVSNLIRGLGEGLAAIALGWKQLLTLTLPVSTYQAVLVPFYVVTFGAVALTVWLALRGGRWAPFAAVPALAPVTFGVVFGASQVSESVPFGSFTLPAPRELAVWTLMSVVGAVWVGWSAGISRRAALRLGRATGQGTAPKLAGRARPRVIRAASAVLTVLVAAGIGLAVTPWVGGERSVPRDRIDPQLVVEGQTSPLAGYRTWKRDSHLDETLFTVTPTASDALPERLRMAVLDAYDGVDFFVQEGADGRFTRFPSGDDATDSSRVHVEFAGGYQSIWLPISPPLADPPRFTGDRADALADAFYVNRETGAAIAVPGGEGVRSGDGYSALMSDPAPGQPDPEPASSTPLIDLEGTPQLASWLQRQQLPSTGAGLTEAIERLRDRGYLSHSLTDGEGERAWLESLEDRVDVTFVSSAGGHSLARIEALFAQLNDQEDAAGESPDERALVAGIGDDEQFATAAALIAQAMGFESRVVVGVRLGAATDEDSGVPGTPACAEACTGEHLAAWIEVRGAGDAWTTLDASPQVEVPPSALERGEQLPEFPTLPEVLDAEEADPPQGATSDSNSQSQDEEEEVLERFWPILRAFILSLLTLMLIALPLLFLPVAKLIRSRRRRAAPNAEVRALGAWDELIDGYADSGKRPRAHAGRRDAADQLAVPAGNRIAATVDRAVYAREGIGAGDVDELWRLVDNALGARRAEQGWWGRLRARFSLHSLIPGNRVWRRRRRSAGRKLTVRGTGTERGAKRGSTR